MRKLLDVLYALAFIAIFTLAQYLASEPPKPRMLMAETETDIEVVDMACPIEGGCDGLETAAK